MEAYAVWLTSLVLLLIASLGLLTWWTLRLIQRWQLRMIRVQVRSDQQTKQLLKMVQDSQLSMQKEYSRILKEHLSLTDKAMAMVGSADALTFQSVQAMSTHSEYENFEQYDPSDDGELARISARNRNQGEGDLSGFEQSILTELGVDPEFLRAD